MTTQYKPVQQASLDWLSYAAPDDIHAPHPDLFEYDLEASLHGVDQSQLQLLNLDYNADSFQFLRDGHSACGPPSTITISSESAYETLSNHSESLYSFPHSPTYSSIESVYSNDLHMGFAKFNVDAGDCAVAAPQPINAAGTLHLIDDTDTDCNSFGELPISPYDSVSSGSSYDYDNPSINPINVITPAEFYRPAQRVLPAPQRTPPTSASISPISIPHPIPRLSIASMSDAGSNASTGSQANGDGRRKYQCPSCPRAFARAYNLKTHMATHDPHRPKPFSCPHKACGRSFSRKHDLGRHLVSIHHDDPEDKKIGVEKGERTWCDSCGKGWTSSSSSCGCET